MTNSSSSSYSEHVDSIFQTLILFAATDRTRSLSQSWNKNVTTWSIQCIILVTLVWSTVDHVVTYTYPWSQKTRTCSNLRSSRIPCGNLESARCRLRRHSLQHQQRWGVTPWAAITVPVSPFNRMDVHERHPARHQAPESTISAGYDWRNAPVCKKVLCTERSCCASCGILRPRWSACISSFDCVLVARIDICYCNLTCMNTNSD